MAAKFGYLLPTRERVMEGKPAALPLLDLAVRAETIGLDSVWIGDSLIDRPRHEPLTMLAAVAARTRKVALGTAVLLPALRNPVVLAHLAATVDQISEGRLILGIGISVDQPRMRAEFEAAGVPFDKRVGRILEGMRLCRALWTGDKVDWDGRWHLEGAQIGPVPHRPGGPPIWMGGSSPGSIQRAGKYFDGWFPISPPPAKFAAQWAEVQQVARDAGRDPAALTGAIYLTVCVDEDAARAEARIGDFLESYYPGRGAFMKRAQSWYAGPKAGAVDWLAAYIAGGASHFIIRFPGDHERHLDVLADIRVQLAG
ncbi:MAG: LLM class flavin-dependent oxidoreductase [Rhodospirillaceae bacterium]